VRLVEFLLSGVCHQMTAHCLHYGGHPLPLCARCSGAFMGISMALLGLWAMGEGRRAELPSGRIRLVLVALLAVWALDGLNSFSGFVRGSPLLYEPSNAVRLVTGVGSGLALGIVLYPAYHFAMWRCADAGRVLDRGWPLVVLLLVSGAGVAILLTWESAPFLFWAIVVTSEATIVLSAVNAVLIALITHREGFAERWTQIAPYFAAGLAASVLETGLLALVRRLVAG
jgi:uncharacterized membrane protein